MAEDIKRRIGERIREAREALHLTQKTLSQATNNVLSDTRIANYEQGTRSPGPTEAIILGRALKRPACWILCVDEENLMPADQRTLLDRYRRTDERGRETILGMAEREALYGNPPAEPGAGTLPVGRLRPSAIAANEPTAKSAPLPFESRTTVGRGKLLEAKQRYPHGGSRMTYHTTRPLTEPVENADTEEKS